MDDNVIRDFFFKLGFDGEDVIKGLKSVQKEFGTLQKNLNKMASTQSRTSKNNQSNLKKEIELERKKLAIKNTSEGIKRGSTTSGVDNQKQKEQLEIQRRITAEAKKQNDYQTNLRKKYVGLTKNRDNFSADVGNAQTRLQGKEQGFAGKEGAAEYKRITARLEELRRAAKSASADGLVDLRRQFKRLNVESAEFIKKNRAVASSMFSTKFAANSMKDSLRNLSRSYLSVFAVGAGAVGTVSVGQNLIALRATLLGVSGDLEKSAEDFEFVKKASKELGIGLSEATSAYGKIGAASKSAGLSSEQAREVFLAVSELSTAFSLDNTDFEGVSRAMSQILSKGKLSTEELLQLGERIPIVFSSAAKALGVTTKELYKEIEKGNIQSVDFAPNVVKEWRSYVRETGMLAAQLKTSRTAAQRFGTTFKENVLKNFDAGMETGLAGFFNGLTGLMEYMSPTFRIVGKVLGVVLETLSAIALAAYQIIRPVGILFETLIVGADDGTDSVGLLMKTFYLLLAAILTPFVWLEKFNNALAESGPIAKTSLAVILVFLSKVLGKFFFMNGFLSKALTGVGSLTKAFSLFGVVAKGVLTAISRHPVIASLLALSTAMEYLQSKEVSSEANVVSKHYSKSYGVSEDNMLLKAFSMFQSYNSNMLDNYLGLVGISPKFTQTRMEGGSTYNINVTTPDTEAAIRTLEPYLENKLTTWGTDIAKSSMAMGEN